MNIYYQWLVFDTISVKSVCFSNAVFCVLYWYVSSFSLSKYVSGNACKEANPPILTKHSTKHYKDSLGRITVILKFQSWPKQRRLSSNWGYIKGWLIHQCMTATLNQNRSCWIKLFQTLFYQQTDNMPCQSSVWAKFRCCIHIWDSVPLLPKF